MQPELAFDGPRSMISSAQAIDEKSSSAAIAVRIRILASRYLR